jgi:mRNA-degrading endonuclease RelE of RelBE toxin-antitoxin system
MKQRPKSPSRAPAAGRSPRAEDRFELRFTPDAGADIQGLDGSIRNQLRAVLEKKLAVNPEGYGLPLRGALANFWKHEFANHRVIYRIYPQFRVVAICAVGIRKQGDAADIYRHLEAVAKSGRLAEQLASVLKKILPET